MAIAKKSESISEEGDLARELESDIRYKYIRRSEAG